MKIRPLNRLMRWAGFGLAVLMSGATHGAEPGTVAVEWFSSMAPGSAITGWEPMTFAKIDAHTRYTLVDEDGRTVLRADSRAAASGLIMKIDLSPTEFPVLTWRWRVSNTMEKGDVRRKSGDDYAARVYLTFADDPSQRTFLQRAQMSAIKLLYGRTPPSMALAYVWGNRSAVGSIHPNPYTDRVRMIVLENGTAHLNQWRWVRRNIVEDFRLAFGGEPPRLSGVAVMTDTDNTGEAATAWYGDIAFHRPD